MSNATIQIHETEHENMVSTYEEFTCLKGEYPGLPDTNSQTSTMQKNAATETRFKVSAPRHRSSFFHLLPFYA